MDMKRYRTSTSASVWRSRYGYSLVEVSLALLVIGVGMLAVFALFPEGLGAARRAVDDVETIMFAEHVFAALAYEAADTNQTWDSFTSGMQLVRSHALEWNSQPIITVNSGFTTPRDFFWIPFYYNPDWGVSTYKVASFTYKLDVGNLPQPPGKYIRLEVWPGEYQASGPSSRGKVFYREFMPVR